MKKFLFMIPVLMLVGIAPIPTHALSCVETGQYLDMVIGTDDAMIIKATVNKTITDKDYTAEVVVVDDALQGYVEKEAFLYHRKDETWGYLCNSGPVGNGKTALYVVSRNDAGQYSVSQTLDPQSDLAKDVAKKITDKKVEGEVVDFSATDRQNQIMTTIMDLFKQISLLLKEHIYWATK